jgi:protein TonB
MKTHLLTSLLLSAAFYAAAQTETVQKDSSTLSADVVEQPKYPGGFEGLAKYLGAELKYPQSARKQGIEGTVFVSFVVETDGSVSHVEVVKGISNECDAEAARVVQKSGPWIPGRLNGDPERVRFVLPIKFSLGKKQGKKG